MDYQIVPKSQKQHFMFVVSFLIISSLPYCLCIVNRDLVLTPKQGLQLSGKRIFYEESFNSEQHAVQHNDSEFDMGTRPWERTLKHLTYLTLFTNAANGIITGNFSKVKEYNEFLDSAYIHSETPIDSRFGDIVTLAQGRLETTSNGSYRFTEGDCDYECARENNIIAMWHVQKIRHRDTADRKYHYEMKFSVSPMSTKAPTETVVRGGPNKRTVMEERRNNVQTFIQKEDDYPHSFRKIVPDKDGDFLEKRYDAGRNFRQVSPHYQTQQVTPIPQSTFLRSVYHHPPPMQHASLHMQRPNVPPHQHHPIHAHNHHHQQQFPLPERLNMGEFYKGNYIAKTTSKVELFPNLLNMFMGKPHTLPPPTTFRPPTYQMKFPRPEIYALQQHQTQEYPKFSEYQQPPPLAQSQEQFGQRTPSPLPIVTHHYHHHFFMPNHTGAIPPPIEQNIQHSGEQNHNIPIELYHNEVTEVTGPQSYITNFNEEPHATTTLRQQLFPQIHQVQTKYHPTSQQQHLNQNYHSKYHFQQMVPPAPQKFSFSNTQIEQQHVVHVTPAPPLRKPQYIQQTQQQQHYENRPFTSSLEYTTVHVPLLISYPAPLSEEKGEDIPTPRNKPFEHSEPMEASIQYSEPDPLYANTNEQISGNENRFPAHGNHQQQDESPAPQLETPNHTQKHRQQNIEVADNKKEHSESVEAQLPAPNFSTIGPELAKTSEDTKRNTTEHDSQFESSIQTAHGKPRTKSNKTQVSNSIAGSTKIPKIFAMRSKRIGLKTATTASTSTVNSPTALPSSSPNPLTTETVEFPTTSESNRIASVSTSSSEAPPLRTISRYRNSHSRNSYTSTTTTEKPVLKWTPRRKNIHAKLMAIRTTTPHSNNKKEEIDESDDKEENDENEDFKVNESNNLRITKPSTILATTTPDSTLDTTTELSNAITSSVSSTTPTISSSSSSQSPSPLLSQTSQSETEIYEILTQKSVSKSVSLKVGNNGEEVPVIIDDGENEVKKV